MSTYTTEQIEEHFQRLPPPLRDHMMSVENSERIFETGKKFGLTIEQIGFLAEESGYVVLGLTHPKDFVSHVSEHLHIDMEKAKNIAREINHQIFFPLREMLKTAHNFELTQEQIQQPPPLLSSLPQPGVQTPPTIKPVVPPAAPSPSISATPSLSPSPSPQTTAPPLKTPPIVAPRPLSPSPSPITSLPPSTLQQQKPAPIRPSPDLPPKTADIIKQPSPPPPSQMMQQKILQEMEKKLPVIQTDADRMKESIFAPPSAPAAPPAQTPAVPPKTSPQSPAPKIPPVAPPASPPSYPNKDPYREPIE